MLVRIAAIVAAAAAAPGAQAAPANPPQNGRIAFAYLTSLIVVNPDGTGAWPAKWDPTYAVAAGEGAVWVTVD